jgi:hypothetical protein
MTATPFEIGGGDDGMNPERPNRPRDVDRAKHGMGVGGTHERHVERLRQADVVDIARLPAYEPRVLRPLHSMADVSGSGAQALFLSRFSARVVDVKISPSAAATVRAMLAEMDRLWRGP